jgi:hypothetical protein
VWFYGYRFCIRAIFRGEYRSLVAENWVNGITGFRCRRFCVILGEIADKMHFSAELGTFLTGSVLSQSVIADTINEMTELLRKIFCAVFLSSSAC